MKNLFDFSFFEWMIILHTAILFIAYMVCLSIAYLAPIRAYRKRSKETPSKETPPISIILYTQNEPERLKVLLSELLSQNYPTYQIVVIDDSPTAKTKELIATYALPESRLYYTFVPKTAHFVSRKKLGLTMGIKAAKYNKLLFTDTTVTINTNLWIYSMARHFNQGKEIVLGCCSYHQHNSFFHRLAAYENLISTSLYASAAILGKPYKGIGSNLAYSKNLFFQNKGFNKLIAFTSGEDDLLINAIATAENTTLTISPESILSKKPYLSLKDFKKSLVQRLGTRNHYKGVFPTFLKIKILVSTFFFPSLLLTLLIGLSTNVSLAVFAFLCWFIRLLYKYYLFNYLAKIFKQSPIGFYLLVLEIIWPLYLFSIKLLRLIKGTNDFIFRLDK